MYHHIPGEERLFEELIYEETKATNSADLADLAIELFYITCRKTEMSGLRDGQQVDRRNRNSENEKG